jgi:hypothetical protein
MKNLSHKNWIAATIILGFLLPICVGIINYIIDPMWCFSSNNIFNQKQEEFNGRIQKINYITFHKKEYKGIIFGSSINTIMSTRKFDIPVFNFSVNAMRSKEIMPLLEYAKKINGKEFNFIIIGLDFIDSTIVSDDITHIEKIISDANNPFYRIKQIISIDTLQYSRKNFINRNNEKLSYYDRDIIKYIKHIPADVLKLHIDGMIKFHNETNDPYTLNGYKRNKNFFKILAEIKLKNPDAKFLVFTNPTSGPFLELLVKKNLLNEYKLWLRDIVKAFGHCWHFMYPNSVINNYGKYFFDTYHYYSDVADMIIDVIYYKKRDNTHADFGIEITNENLDIKIEQLDSMLKNYKSPAP